MLPAKLEEVTLFGTEFGPEKLFGGSHVPLKSPFLNQSSWESLLCSLIVRHGYSALPHLASPYKGEGKNTVAADAGCLFCQRITEHIQG